MRRAIIAFSPALLYAGVIFYLSAQPNPLPFLPRSVFSHDKLLHLGEYGGFATLLAWGLWSLRVAPWRAFFLALAIGSAYGASDEFHQYFVPNRECDVYDWMADTLGAALGAAVTLVALQRREARASIGG
ncbi:MAG TPA: VanZ family protein [Anaeromyxobacteraceae bacterium]|nr:VanZ family protein [Anaeromyxobacteraceae bacterium]